MDASERQRIAVIANLLQRARSAFSENTDIGNGVSVSQLHDAIEHALYLTLVKNHVTIPQRSDFKDLVEKTSQLFRSATNEEMSYKTPLETLNKIRVAFKHNGIVPARGAAMESIEDGVGFLQHLFSRMFAINIENFDISDAIRIDEIREKVKLAVAEVEKGNFQNAVSACAEANWLFETALRFLFRPTATPRIQVNIGNHRADQYATAVIDKVLEYVSKADSAILTSSIMVTAGIDILETARFRRLLPNTNRFGSGEFQHVYTREPPSSDADVRFMMRYMTGIALWLEERFPTLNYVNNSWRI